MPKQRIVLSELEGPARAASRSKGDLEDVLDSISNAAPCPQAFVKTFERSHAFGHNTCLRDAGRAFAKLEVGCNCLGRRKDADTARLEA